MPRCNVRLPRSVTALSLVALILLGCQGAPAPSPAASNKPAAGASSARLVMAHAGTPELAVSLGYEKFAELVKQKTDGAVTIDVQGGGKLASEVEAVKGAMQGNLDLASLSTSNFSALTETFYFSDLPYIFDSVESMWKVYDGPLGQGFKERVEQELKMKVLMYMPTGGWRVLGNSKREVRVPEDASGLKLRATSPVEIAVGKAWGANPTPMAYAETLNALRQGVVDGELLQYTWIWFAKHYEGLKYLTELESTTPVHVGQISLASFEKLVPDQQQAVMEAAREAEAYTRTLDDQQIADAKEQLTKNGLTIYKPTSAELEQWKTKALATYDQFADKVPAEFVNRVREAQKK